MKVRNFDYLILPVMLAALAVGLILSAGVITPAQRSSAPEIELTRYLSPVPTEVPPTAEPTAVAQVPDTNAAAGTGAQNVSFDAIAIEHGRGQFQTTCSACHGSNARGIPGLGKDLIQSEFVSSMSDEELLQFIIVGRQAYDPANTTGVTMPGRGGNPMLTDAQIGEIITYLRATAASDLGSVPVETGSSVVQQPAQPAAEFVLPIVAMGLADASEPVADAGSGTTADEAATAPVELTDAARAYNLSCAGCHGLNGEGTPNNGTPLVDNMLLQNSPDAVIVYLSQLQPPVDPRDDFPHPVMGEYPVLTPDELRALVDYARTLGQ